MRKIQWIKWYIHTEFRNTVYNSLFLAIKLGLFSSNTFEFQAFLSAAFLSFRARAFTSNPRRKIQIGLLLLSRALSDWFNIGIRSLRARETSVTFTHASVMSSYPELQSKVILGNIVLRVSWLLTILGWKRDIWCDIDSIFRISQKPSWRIILMSSFIIKARIW